MVTSLGGGPEDAAVAKSLSGGRAASVGDTCADLPEKTAKSGCLCKSKAQRNLSQ